MKDPTDELATHVAPSSNHRGPRSGQQAVYLLLALAIFRFWGAPSGSSFWLDETGTFWAIKDGLGQMFARVRSWPEISSALYGLVTWAFYAVGGAREYVMRLPSLIAISLAALLIYRLAGRIIDEDSALPAVAVFISSGTVAFAACDARPYALLLLLVAGSTLALVRWLETGATRYAGTYVVTAALALYTHYLAFPILAAHAAYALARLREGGPVPLKRLLIGAAAIGILLAPLSPVYLSLFENRRVYAFTNRPDAVGLAELLAPPVLFFAVTVGLMLAKLVCGHLAVGSIEVRQSTFVLLATLAFAPAFLFFAISILTSAKIFVPRYMIESQVALALFAGWGISRLRLAMARSIVTGTILACAIGAFGSLSHLRARHGHEDWRGAMAEVRRVAGNIAVPVIVESGFFESYALAEPGQNVPPYLMAPLMLYPAGGHVIPIPLRFDERSRLYFESTGLSAIDHSQSFVLVTGHEGTAWKTWLEGRFPGWTAKDLGDFDDIKVTLFQSGQSQGP